MCFASPLLVLHILQRKMRTDRVRYFDGAVRIEIGDMDIESVFSRIINSRNDSALLEVLCCDGGASDYRVCFKEPVVRRS